MTVGLGNLVVALVCVIAGVQLAVDGHTILGFITLVAAIMEARQGFRSDDDNLPPPQHPLVGA